MVCVKKEPVDVIWSRLLSASGHLPVPPDQLQAADLQQRVRVPMVGRGAWLVPGAVLHALHPRQPSLQTLQSQGNLQRGPC